MIHDNLELHNVVELDSAAGGGVHLRRFPSAIRQAMSPLGRMVALESAGCEVRFVTESTSVRVAVSTLPSCFATSDRQPQDVLVFKGPFFHSCQRIEPGRVNHLSLNDIGGAMQGAIDKIRPESRATDYFSHHVWRIMFGRYPAILHEVDAYGSPVRPPHPDELPKRRMLFYGSSITSGGASTLYHLCYVQHAARRLKVDPLNQGLSGSCRCEPEVVEYLADRDDWDIISLELGVNMRGGFTPDEFRTRARSLVTKIIEKHPAKPVVLITIFPNAESPENAVEANDMQLSQVAFNQILRELAVELKHPQLHLVEGEELLTEYSNISKDLIHPSDYGHAEMGINLAAKLRHL